MYDIFSLFENIDIITSCLTQVERSSAGQVPVYTDIKGGGTKVITILRKCSGDINALREDMEKVVMGEVEVRPGKLIARGNHSALLKRWLMGLGF